MTGRKGEDQHQERGSTLIEVLVVLAIVAAIIAIAAPSFRAPVERVQLRSLATQVAAELRVARAAAIHQSLERAFLFNAIERWYEVEGSGRRVPLPDGVSVTFTTARQYVRPQEGAQLMFFPDGSSSGGRLVLAGGGERAVIAVDWLSGVARLESVP